MARRDQLTLFERGKRRPRAKPRVMMHVFDVENRDYEPTDYSARFECRKCGYRSGWIGMKTYTEVQRGSPCPKCNKELK